MFSDRVAHNVLVVVTLMTLLLAVNANVRLWKMAGWLDEVRQTAHTHATSAYD